MHMRILWCSWKDLSHPLSGGAEIYTHAVASRLTAAGHEVHLACSAVNAKPADECVDGVHVRRRGGALVGTYREARLFYERSCRDWDLIIDEINTRPFNAPLWSRSTPVLALCHQITREVWHSEAPMPLAILGRWVLEPWWWTRYQRTTVATISRSTADSVRALGTRDVRVLPVGSEQVERPDVSRALRPTVISVGRISSAKRPLDVLRSHQALLLRRPDAQLWFIGDGPELGSLRDAAVGVSGVEVLGRVSHAEKCERLATAWALASASVREGWGLVVSEAAAMGTFSAAYRVPGLTDSVSATGGVLCDENPTDLAKALDTNLDRFRETHPASTGTSTWDEVAEQFEALAFEVSSNRACIGAKSFGR